MCCSSHMFQYTHLGIPHSLLPSQYPRRIPALWVSIRKYGFQRGCEKLFWCPCILYLGALVFFDHKSKSTPLDFTLSDKFLRTFIERLDKRGKCDSNNLTKDFLFYSKFKGLTNAENHI